MLLLQSIFGIFVASVVGMIIVYFLHYRFLREEEDKIKRAAERNTMRKERKELDRIHQKFIRDCVIERDLYK